MQATSSKQQIEQLWARQDISREDVDYNIWHSRRESLMRLSQVCSLCLFTVDVYKERYDFASEGFSQTFGFKPSHLRNIHSHGDMIEDRIHPDDRAQIAELQIRHSHFIYSLPKHQRNDYQSIYQFRMLDARNKYINTISRQEVIQTDSNGKAWIVMGQMEVFAEQTPMTAVRHTMINKHTGELQTSYVQAGFMLSVRELDVLNLMAKGLLSKEIARYLNISLHTVNNHRKNILMKLSVYNTIEAINKARSLGILS